VTQPNVTRSRLVADLTALGVTPGTTLMVHTRMSALGWVVGGAPTVVDALIAVLGPAGCILVLTGWEDRPPYHQDDWPDSARAAYREECPAFDPRVARAEVEHGRVPEALRTWPGAHHSPHPVCSFAAIGAGAASLVAGQSIDEGYGAGSPLAHLVARDGAVLMLGAPLGTVTLLHHAEYVAEAGPKRWVEYEMPVLVDGVRTWRRIRELDSSRGALPYERLDLEDDEFEEIGRSALEAGIGSSGPVGEAEGHLFPARALVSHAVAWIEHRFSNRAGDP
jgi:aminoglycoside 3-N-acetyltransferase